MYEDLIFKIALTQIPQVGPIHARTLINTFQTSANVFKAQVKQLEKIEGIGSIRARNIKHFQHFGRCEEEAKYIVKHKIHPLFISDQAYPSRLLHCADAPILLFYKGTCDVQQKRILSVVGTRSPTIYGKQQCENIISQLPENVLIVSGLATGIDTIAHHCALKSGKHTIGIMAHGHDRIYPYENKKLAKEMLNQGGLLTEFTSGSIPDRENFPKRNRIIAGMCDAILVIETGIKGGSMISADLANGYNRDVFALPGRILDAKSEGCNQLIKQNKAQLICNADDILNAMNWDEKKVSKKTIQKELFVTLSEDEKLIREYLLEEEKHIDQLRLPGLTPGKIAALLLTLELKGMVEVLPGKIYRWNTP